MVDVGIFTTSILEEIFTAFEIWESPWVGFPIEVPTAPFALETVVATYRFGGVDDRRFREISCDATKLDFQECFIPELALGRRMRIKYRERVWDTERSEVALCEVGRIFDPVMRIL